MIIKMMGLIAILGFLLIFFLLYREVKLIFNDEREYSDSRIGVFYAFSTFLVIFSISIFMKASYDSYEMKSVGVSQTILFAAGSYLLTVGFAAIVYYSQAIESRSSLKKLERLLDGIVQAKLESATSQSEKYDSSIGVFVQNIKQDIKNDLLNQIKSEIQEEIKS